MEFKLSVPERLTLLSILPQENNFINLQIIRGASFSIGFGDEESVELSIKQTGENISFDAKKGIIEKPIEIGERAYALICEVLEKLDKEKKLTQSHFTLYEKFIKRESQTH